MRGRPDARASLTDLEAVARSLDDPAAFSELLTRHHAAVYRYLARRLSLETAEEQAQEAFVRAFAGRRSFRPYRDSALPWLFGIATNLVHEQRRQGRRALLVPNGAEFAWPDDGEALSRVAAIQFRQKLVEAIAELPPVDQDIVFLAAVAELKPAEIAAALDTSARTVSTRLHRALGRMRLRLEDDACARALAKEVPDG